MYKSLVDILFVISLTSNLIIAFGVLFFIWAWIGIVVGLWKKYYGDHSLRGNIFLISGVFSLLLFIFCIVFGTSYYMKPEWHITRTIAIEIDKYGEKNPDAIFNPNILINNVDKAVVSIFTAIQETPNLIQKLSSGYSMEDIQSERDQKEFEAWKASRFQQ
jgi:hypothetical protein